MAPYLEQTLITHTQGLLGYNILEFCQVPGSSGEEDFEGLHQICYVQIVFG